MNKLRIIFSGKQYLILLMAWLMLLATGYRPVNTELLSIGSDEVCQQAESEQEAPSKGRAVLSAAYEAIVPAFKVQVAFVYKTVLEFKLIEVIVEGVRQDLPLPQSSYFRILFRTFISPNAP